jgi:hypothetical protein
VFPLRGLRTDIEAGTRLRRCPKASSPKPCRPDEDRARGALDDGARGVAGDDAAESASVRRADDDE